MLSRDGDQTSYIQYLFVQEQQYIHYYDEVLANINSVLASGHLTNRKFNNTDTYRDYSSYDDIDAAPIRPYVR